MATKLTSDSPTQEARLPGEKEFKRLLSKLKAAESEISQAKGEMGSAVEKAVATHNLHPDALRVFRKYAKKNPTQCAEFMLHLQTYWEYGKLGEPDADLVETPAERKGRMTKSEIEDEEAAAPARAIRGGKVVDIHGEDAAGAA